MGLSSRMPLDAGRRRDRERPRGTAPTIPSPPFFNSLGEVLYQKNGTCQQARRNACPAPRSLASLTPEPPFHLLELAGSRGRDRASIKTDPSGEGTASIRTRTRKPTSSVRPRLEMVSLGRGADRHRLRNALERCRSDTEAVRPRPSGSARAESPPVFRSRPAAVRPVRGPR